MVKQMLSLLMPLPLTLMLGLLASIGKLLLLLLVLSAHLRLAR